MEVIIGKCCSLIRIFHMAVNQWRESRWSMNCRSRSLYLLYSDSRLGKFFEPIALRADFRIGLNYQD